MINPEAHDTDAELERLIDFQAGLLAKRLHGQRSAEQVERMEREIFR